MLGKYAETAIDWLSCTAGSARQHTQNFAVHAWHVIVHLLLVPEVVCLLLRCSCGSLCCMELLTQIADLGGKPASLPFMWACMSLLCTSSITPHGEDVCLVLKSGQTIISITNSITVLITEQQVYRSMLWVVCNSSQDYNTCRTESLEDTEHLLSDCCGYMAFG